MGNILDDTLEFWISIAYDDAKNSDESSPRKQFYSLELLEWEEAGLAMRYLNADGRLAWKATPRFLQRLAEQELEARAESRGWR